MRARMRGVAVVIIVALGNGGLTGCTPSSSSVVGGSTVTVVSAQPFTSFNDQTSFGNTPENVGIVAAANAGFVYYNDDRELVRDESFGHFEIVSQSPFAVRYTVNEGVVWSDGEPVDAADLLLAWAANSGHFTTEGFDPRRYVDDETGLFGEFPADVVYFDGASSAGLQMVSALPELGPDGRSITLSYDDFFVDWQLAFEVGLPAHVVALKALPIAAGTDETEAEAAKRAVVEAIEDADTAVLAPLATAWNSAFTLGSDPIDPGLFVGSGPYSITAIEPKESVTLTANPLYTGQRQPRFETVVIRTISDPLAAVAALGEGEVDVIAPAPTLDVMRALEELDEVHVVTGESGMFEHIDLQFSGSRNGTFDDPLLREAFMYVVPRQQILDELVAPIAPEAVLRSSFLFAPDGEVYDRLVENNGSIRFEGVDVDHAKVLIEQAGAIAPPVCLLFDPANPRRVTEFELIKASAERAGFVVQDCSASDWEGLLGVPGAYDAAIFAWDETTAAVSSPAARLASTSTISNFSHYSNPGVDRLLAELAVEDDAADQRDLLTLIDAQLWADSYGLPLYQFPTVVAHRSGIENVSVSPLGPGLLWNLWQWQPRSEAG